MYFTLSTSQQLDTPLIHGMRYKLEVKHDHLLDEEAVPLKEDSEHAADESTSNVYEDKLEGKRPLEQGE